MADVTERPPVAPCPYGWGDFRCERERDHTGPHALVWAGDEDSE